MANYTYYYEFTRSNTQYEPGVYRTKYNSGRMRGLATRSWIEGPKGGVQVVGEWWLLPRAERLGYGYKTTDPNAMKVFTWVKLTAKDHDN